MIESLNSSNLQRLSAELAAGRLDSLLRIGQTVNAQVVSVTPLMANKAVVANSQSEAGNTAQNRPQTTTGNPLANSGSNSTAGAPAGSTNRPGSAPSSPTSPASSQNTQTNAPSPQTSATHQAGYRAKLNVQGRLLEIITPQPLPKGSEVQISRDSGTRITVSTPAPANPGPGAQTQSALANSNASVNANTATAQNRAAAPVPENARNPSQPANSAAGGSTSTPHSQNAQVAAVRSNSQAAIQALSQWLKPGERIQAQVLQSRPATEGTQQSAATRAQTATSAASHTGGYRVQVEAQGRTLELLSPRPLPAGAEVRIRHDRSGQIQVEIPASKSQAVDQSLRQHLPQQQLPSQLLNLLADPQTAQQISRSQPLLQGLIQLLLGRSLNTPQQTNSEGLRQQLQTSGVQLEQQLARGNTQPLQQDQKALLLRLNQALNQGSSQGTGQSNTEAGVNQRLAQVAQGALSRVFYNQLTSLFQHQQDAAPEANRHLALDIPVLWQGRSENIHLRISRDEESATPEAEAYQRRWRVQLRFSLDDLPDMGADIRLQQDNISVTWYGDTEVKDLLQPHFSLLAQRLEAIGLEVDELNIREQQPPQPSGPAPATRLIETKV